MSIKLHSFFPILNLLLSDKMDILRYNSYINEDGTTGIGLIPVPVATGVSCRISFSSRDNPKDEMVDENPIRYSPKIFCPPDTDIQTGDEIVIKRLQDNGSVMEVYEGQVGQFARYPTHLEAAFYIKESA